jgi:iron complex transport system substrate-binding protein
VFAVHRTRLIAGLLLAGSGVACSREPARVTDASTEDRWTRPLAERAADPFPRRFRNLKGDEYVISAPPERIASSKLFTDVVLMACCPLNRIAALHEVSKKPLFSPIASASQRFPRHLTPDPESVRVVRPDLVFLASYSDKRSERLVSDADCVVVRLHQLSSIAGVQQSIRNVGYITGLDAAAEQLVVEMEARLAKVAAGKSRRGTWRVLSFDSGFVAGAGTIFDDVIGCVGAVNLAAATGIKGTSRVSQERLLTMKPDAIVIGVLVGQEAEAKDRLMQLSGMRILDAVKRDRIVYVPNHLMMSASHPLAGLAEAIAQTLDRWKRP